LKVVSQAGADTPSTNTMLKKLGSAGRLARAALCILLIVKAFAFS
jgi:hypothetical protein